MADLQPLVKPATLRGIFSRNHGLGSILIRLASWSGRWSHVGVLTEQGTVVEATAWHGVVETPLEEFLARSTAHEVVEYECHDPVAAVAFARSQIGKPYDWSAIFGLIFRERWALADRWFCSELFSASLAAGDRPRFRLDASRVTPANAYMVN